MNVESHNCLYHLEQKSQCIPAPDEWWECGLCANKDGETEVNQMATDSVRRTKVTQAPCGNYRKEGSSNLCHNCGCWPWEHSQTKDKPSGHSVDCRCLLCRRGEA